MNILQYKKADVSKTASACHLVDNTWHTLILVSETHWSALLAMDQVFFENVQKVNISLLHRYHLNTKQTEVCNTLLVDF